MSIATRATLFLSLLPAIATASSLPSINVINLDRDTARLESVLKQLTDKGVPLESIQRQPAVLGSALSNEEMRSNTTRMARWFATRGMIGCFLSHRNFWQRTLEGDAEWALVVEDDVEVEDNFYERVVAAVKELDGCPEAHGEWDVLMIGAIGCVNPERSFGLNRINSFVSGGGRTPKRLSEHIHVPRRPFGTHAYVLSKRGAAKLLRVASLASMHVDAVAWGIQELNLYCVHPMLAHQAFDDSTVGGTQRGPEALIPNLVIDPYTRITLRWAFNEPVINVPFTGVTLTIGRSLLLLIVGYAVAAATGSRALFAAHTMLTISCFLLLRVMVQPAAAARLDDDAGGAPAPPPPERISA